METRDYRGKHCRGSYELMSFSGIQQVLCACVYSSVCMLVRLELAAQTSDLFHMCVMSINVSRQDKLCTGTLGSPSLGRHFPTGFIYEHSQCKFVTKQRQHEIDNKG